MANGFMHHNGVDYSEVFATVVRTLLALGFGQGMKFLRLVSIGPLSSYED